MYSFLLPLAAIIIATKLLGELARRFGQPSMLGELLAGVVLGGGVLALVDPRDPSLHALGEFGLFVLVFQIGIHTDARSLRRIGTSAVAVAVAGAILPFAGGFFAARALGATTIAAVIVGVSLTATSVAVSARVLGDKGVLRTSEGQVVLGAALIDDAIGLVVLSIAAALIGGATVSAQGVIRASMLSLGFIVVALAVGRFVVPPLFRALDGIHAERSPNVFGLAFGLLVAALAVASGNAMVIGAFLGGLILHPTAHRHDIERTTAQIGHVLVPVYFAIVGASVDLRALASAPALELGAALIVVATLGKVVAGFAPWMFTGNKMLIGAALLPRGEIGVVFAQVGLAAGAITPAAFGAITLMIVVTTLISPPLVGALIRRDDSLDREEVEPSETRGADARRQTTIGRRH